MFQFPTAFLALDVLFVDEQDPHVNPLGVKGVGEIAMVGVAPAITNDRPIPGRCRAQGAHPQADPRPVGKLTPDEARTLARKAVGSIAHGADPAGKRTEDRKGLTVGRTGGRILSDHVEAKRRAGTAAHYRTVALGVPALPLSGGRSL
jgi:hypothetical protein